MLAVQKVVTTPYDLQILPLLNGSWERLMPLNFHRGILGAHISTDDSLPGYLAGTDTHRRTDIAIPQSDFADQLAPFRWCGGAHS